jgi:hypothetical protein
VDHIKYHPGQVWDYKYRDSEPLSTLTILKLTTQPSGKTVIHIRIDGVHITDVLGREVSHTITHTVVTVDALDESVTGLVRESAAIPDFSEGYADWLKDSGGAFILTVAEVVAGMEHTMRYGHEPTQ